MVGGISSKWTNQTNAHNALKLMVGKGNKIFTKISVLKPLGSSLAYFFFLIIDKSLNNLTF